MPSATGSKRGTRALVNARRLVPQLGDVLVPLPGCEPPGCSTNPLDGVLDVEVPEPGRPIEAATGQHVLAGAERHRPDGGGASGQGLADWAGVRGIRDVPQPDLAVGAAAGQRVPARAERHRHSASAAGHDQAERTGCAGSVTSHSRTTPSTPPLASVLPPGLNATEYTVPVPPVRGWPSGWGCAGSARSHSRTMPPELPLASICPAALNATELTPPAPAARGEDRGVFS